MRWMLDHPQRRQSFAVVAAACISILLRDLDIRLLRNVGDMLGASATALVILFGIALAICVSVVAFFVFSAAATVAGRMLGGGGMFRDVRTAVAWGLAPQAWAIVYRIPAVLIAPDAVSAVNRPGIRIAADTIELTPLTSEFFVLMVLELVFLVWYCVVGSGTLGEAHRFSSLRGFATLLLAVVLPFALILVIIAAAFLAASTS